MKGRGNPPLPLYLLLVIYGARAAGEETSASPPMPITSVSEYTSSSGNKSLQYLGTTATNLPATESTLLHGKYNISATTNQSALDGSVAVTESQTTSKSNYTDTAHTLVLSTTVSTQNYSELTISVPTKSTQHAPKMSDRPTTTSNLSNNVSFSTEQRENVTQHPSNISVQPNTTVLTNTSTSRSESVEQTTTVILPQHNTSSLYTIQPSSNTNLSSRTESVTQHVSYTAQPLTTAPLTNNQSSSTGQPTLYAFNISTHHTTTQVPTILSSSVLPTNMTSFASENNTTPVSSTTDRTITVETTFLPVNTTRFHVNTTHLPDSITNSNASTTGFGVVSTKHSNMSSTVKTVTTRGSTVTNLQRTETPMTSTNATFTIQSYTSNKPQTHTNTSAFVTNNISPVEHSTKSPNKTTQGLSTITMTTVPPRSSISPPLHDHTEGSVGSTTSGFQQTTITDSNPCRNIQCPSISICVPRSPGYSCVAGKIFPGQLTLKSRTYSPEMANKTSAVFIKTASEIETVLNTILKNQSGYIGSAVRKLMRGSVIANTENIFQQSSNVTSGGIAEEIKAFIGRCIKNCGPLDRGDGYMVQSLCSLNKCDNMTTICSSENGAFACECKEGFYKLFPSEQSCAACPSGYKLENDLCVKCPFGYAGFNCDDSSLLAVVVISCVLGSLLLILLTSLYISCYRSKKLQRETYEHEAYLMWPKQEFPKIPRVTMSRDASQLDYGSKNILVDNEMSNGNTVSPEASRIEGDLKTFSNKDSSRYSYLSHGQTNPYFVNEEN